MTPRTCSVCGCFLAHDNPSTTCAVHRPPEPEPDDQGLFLEGDDLMCVVAGILLVHRALRPGKPVHLQRELRKLKIEATTEQIHVACRKLPRRGLNVVARSRQTGYRLRDWFLPKSTVIWAQRQQQAELLDAGSTTEEEET
jgi:hypothetical protein